MSRGRMKTLRTAFLPALGALAVLSGSVICRRKRKSRLAAARVPRLLSCVRRSAAKAPDAAGFLQRWLILEPIRVAPQLTDSAVQAVVKKNTFRISSPSSRTTVTQ